MQYLLFRVKGVEEKSEQDVSWAVFDGNNQSEWDIVQLDKRNEQEFPRDG